MTEFLPIDGSKPMTGDLNFAQDFAIQRLGVDQVTYVSATDLWDFLAHVRIRGSLRFDDYLTWQAAANRDLLILNSQGINIYDGAAYQEVMKFVRAAVPYVDIPRAGDITPVGDQTENLGVSAHEWLNIYGRNLRAASLITSPLINPVGGTGTGSIGQAAVRWLNIFVDVLDCWEAKFTGTHISMANLPNVDPADGTGELWCDLAAGRVIKLGT